MAPEPRNRVILDPSVLFTDAAVGWLEDASLRPHLAVSLAVRQLLTDPSRFDLLAQFEGFDVADRSQQLLNLLEGVEIFSWEGVNVPSASAAIRDELLKSGDPLSNVFADEWVFLVSQSWGVFSPVARALQAIGDAGARVYEVTEAQMQAALEAIREQLPPPVLHGMKAAARLTDRVPGFWIAAGGTAAGALVPALGLPVAVLGLVLAGEAVIAGDP